MKIPNVAEDALYPAVYDSLNRLTTIRNTGNTADVASFDYDALGRRIRYVDQDSRFTKWYYYDGVNEILETDGSTDLTWYVHGVSYIDERLMMHAAFDVTETEMVDASFYYAMDRMYDVRYLLDAAGAIVESYVYDPYGRPLIRECAGRGDLTGDSVVDANDDQSMFDLARDCQLFDPRGDLDDDGDVDGDDATLMSCKQAVWTGSGPTSVRMARSVHGNPYMFQGRPQFAIDTEEGATAATLLLNDHRNRFADPMTGRWLTRDPIGYIDSPNLFEFAHSSPVNRLDPMGNMSPPTTGPATQPTSGPSTQPAVPAFPAPGHQNDEACKDVKWDETNEGGSEFTVWGTTRCDGKGNAILCINPKLLARKNSPGADVYYGATYWHEMKHVEDANKAGLCKDQKKLEDPNWGECKQAKSECEAYTLSLKYLEDNRSTCNRANNKQGCFKFVDKSIATEKAQKEKYCKEQQECEEKEKQKKEKKTKC